MATKKYNEKYINCFVEKKAWIALHCYTTNTRHGFCHTAKMSLFEAGQMWQYSDTKISYYNRTWESFEYETALIRAIEKLPKQYQDAARAKIYAKN